MSHASSSMTFFYKYVFPILWIGGFGTAMFFVSREENEFAQQWMLSAGAMVVPASFWLIWLATRLRTVEANESKVSIKTSGGMQEIDYENIVWVSQIAFTNPVFIRMKYTDQNSMKTNSILIMPNRSSEMFKWKFFEDHAMTAFLRKNIKEANSNYSKDAEPSKWLPILYIFGSIILFRFLVLGATGLF